MIAEGLEIQHQFIVNQKIYNGFIDIFKDQNPMHIDADFAQSHGFEDKVMFGNILNGFLSYFIGELLPIKEVVIISQDIKYHRPFYLNDTLSFSAKCSEVFEAVNAYNFKYKFTVKETTVAKGNIMIKRLA